jgi:uncharacterized protein (TIGR00255 family)
MTGFGRCEMELDGRKIVVELKSVNNRYLDVSIRTPKVLSLLEENIRSQIKERLARGHVDAYIYYQNLRQDAKKAHVDLALLRGYMQAMDMIATESGLPNDLTLADIARLPDLVTMVEESSKASENLNFPTILPLWLTSF